MSDKQPTGTEVKQHLPNDSRVRSTMRGVLLFLLSFMGYVYSFAVAASDHRWYVLAASSTIAFVFISTLFVIGHDACHGSLTPSPILNRLLGRLSFLPNYHPYSSWEHTHNGLHHGMTNVRGHDPVFVPLSKAEYDSLPCNRQLLHRIYRTTFGLGLYYFCTIWLALEMFPTREFRPIGTRAKKFNMDRLTIASFAMIQVIIVVALSRSLAIIPLHLFSAVIAPFILFNCAMGFVIFLHHTHPRVPWYKSRADFSFFSSQVRSSVHAEFPRILELILHNIMDHTAHHADPRIPLYNLHESQHQLEEAYHTDIIVEPWSLRGWRRTLAVCRLYDYENNRWLDYDGSPTSDPLLQASP